MVLLLHLLHLPLYATICSLVPAAAAAAAPVISWPSLHRPSLMKLDISLGVSTTPTHTPPVNSHCYENVTPWDILGKGRRRRRKTNNNNRTAPSCLQREGPSESTCIRILKCSFKGQPLETPPRAIARLFLPPKWHFWKLS